MKPNRRRKPRKTHTTKSNRSHQVPRSAPGIIEWIKSFATAVGLFLLFRTFLTQAYAISSGSMENSLLVGDYLMANKAIYGAEIPLTGLRTPAFREPRPGDVVIFRPGYNDPVLDVVKRVIAGPGDTIQMIERVVFRNGRAVDEPYVEPSYAPDVLMERAGELGSNCCYEWHLEHLVAGVDSNTYRPTRDNWGPLVVPAHEYLMLGDNRDESLDSRYVGFIPRDVILGKASFIYYSVDSSSIRPFPRILTAVRTNRVGKLVR